MATDTLLSHEKIGNVWILGFPQGNLVSEDDCRAIREELDAFIENALGDDNLALSLLDVTFLAESLYNMLAQLYKKLKANGKSLVLCGVCENIKNNLHTLRFDRLFVILSDHKEVVRHFSRAT